MFLFLLAGLMLSPANQGTSGHANADAPPPPLPTVRDVPAELFERDVVPTTKLHMLFSTEDYPAEAIGRSEQGMVAVVLRVDGEGRVSDCLIEESSGSAALDHQTCRVIWTRARFKPARDEKGNAVESAFRQRIRWELPDPQPSDFADLFARHVLTVSSKREIVSCRYEASPQWDKPASGCARVIEDMRPFLVLSPEWIPFADRELVAEMKYIVGHPAGGQELGERRGEFLMVLRRLLLTVDAAGSVKNCSQESWGVFKAKPEFFDCEVAGRWQFEALPNDEKNRSDRQLTAVRAVYLRAQSAAPSDPLGDSVDRSGEQR